MSAIARIGQEILLTMQKIANDSSGDGDDEDDDSDGADSDGDDNNDGIGYGSDGVASSSRNVGGTLVYEGLHPASVLIVRGQDSASQICENKINHVVLMQCSGASLDRVDSTAATATATVSSASTTMQKKHESKGSDVKTAAMHWLYKAPEELVQFDNRHPPRNMSEQLQRVHARNIWRVGCLLADLFRGSSLFQSPNTKHLLISQICYRGSPPAWLIRGSEWESFLFESKKGDDAEEAVASFRGDSGLRSSKEDGDDNGAGDESLARRTDVWHIPILDKLRETVVFLRPEYSLPTRALAEALGPRARSAKHETSNKNDAVGATISSSSSSSSSLPAGGEDNDDDDTDDVIALQLFFDLLQRMLHMDPSKRLTLRDAPKHAFFARALTLVPRTKSNAVARTKEPQHAKEDDPAPALTPSLMSSASPLVQQSTTTATRMEDKEPQQSLVISNRLEEANSSANSANPDPNKTPPFGENGNSVNDGHAGSKSGAESAVPIDADTTDSDINTDTDDSDSDSDAGNNRTVVGNGGPIKTATTISSAAVIAAAHTSSNHNNAASVVAVNSSSVQLTKMVAQQPTVSVDDSKRRAQAKEAQQQAREMQTSAAPTPAPTTAPLTSSSSLSTGAGQTSVQSSQGRVTSLPRTDLHIIATPLVSLGQMPAVAIRPHAKKAAPVSVSVAAATASQMPSISHASVVSAHVPPPPPPTLPDSHHVAPILARTANVSLATTSLAPLAAPVSTLDKRDSSRRIQMAQLAQPAKRAATATTTPPSPVPFGDFPVMFGNTPAKLNYTGHDEVPTIDAASNYSNVVKVVPIKTTSSSAFSTMPNLFNVGMASTAVATTPFPAVAATTATMVTSAAVAVSSFSFSSLVSSSSPFSASSSSSSSLFEQPSLTASTVVPIRPILAYTFKVTNKAQPSDVALPIASPVALSSLSAASSSSSFSFSTLAMTSVLSVPSSSAASLSSTMSDASEGEAMSGEPEDHDSAFAPQKKEATKKHDDESEEKTGDDEVDDDDDISSNKADTKEDGEKEKEEQEDTVSELQQQQPVRNVPGVVHLNISRDMLRRIRSASEPPRHMHLYAEQMAGFARAPLAQAPLPLLPSYSPPSMQPPPPQQTQEQQQQQQQQHNYHHPSVFDATSSSDRKITAASIAAAASGIRTPGDDKRDDSSEDGSSTTPGIPHGEERAGLPHAQSHAPDYSRKVQRSKSSFSGRIASERIAIVGKRELQSIGVPVPITKPPPPYPVAMNTRSRQHQHVIYNYGDND